MGSINLGVKNILQESRIQAYVMESTYWKKGKIRKNIERETKIKKFASPKNIF